MGLFSKNRGGLGKPNRVRGSLVRATKAGDSGLVGRILRNAWDPEGKDPALAEARKRGLDEIAADLLAHGAKETLVSGVTSPVRESVSERVSDHRTKTRASIWSRLFGSRSPRVQVYDLRSDDYKRREKEVAAGMHRRPESKRLLALLREAVSWGARNEWPVFDSYPQAEAIRSIGTALDREGGLQLMVTVAMAIQCEDRELASFLSTFWNGTGNWLD